MAPARGRSSANTATQSHVAAELPEYQPPSYPLNVAAQQILRDLPLAHKLDSLKLRLKTANDHLTDSAAEINDRFQERNAQNEKRKARRAALTSSQEENDETERKIEDMRKATEKMTEDLDRGIRRVIDGGEEVKIVEEVLRELNSNATSGRNAPTQSTLGASQFRQNRRRGDDSVDEDGDENMHEGADAETVKGAVEVLKEKLDQHRALYSQASMTDRYASHNDYVGFKKIVHDAHYPGEEAPPMPHASTWFADGASTQLPSSNGPGGTQQEDDDDDDLIMASERISVKCPITLTEMKDPVSSTKCPHNFERQAFLEMVHSSEVRVDAEGKIIEGGGRRNGRKAMRCPVPGCDAILEPTDIHTDAVLVRKIKRIQAALRAQNEPDYDDDDSQHTFQRRGGRGHPDEEITSSSPAQPPTASMATAARIKAERMSRAPSSRHVSMIPSTQIVDMEDDDADED